MLDRSGFRKMGGKRHASSPASPMECCMCGDRGLEEELFKCTNCSVRLQHKYCSNLYPKLDRYLACNWCLREEGVKLQSPGESASASGRVSISDVKLRRIAVWSNADEQPIKKQRLPPHPREPTTSSDAAERAGMKTLRPGLGRVRVRRYKLLGEVYN